ncbi:MAG TPA: magnesium transporter CorA family protein [Sphingomicrobium sp.]|nr:magnesium transporter CorA family protein [Sphingomicrobium sp.]
MLRAYGPDCDGSIVDPHHGPIPPGATWIDLEEPTREEERLVEQLIGHNVPTEQELAEIEPSSRLFERDGALYMTLSALFGVSEGRPATTPIGFVLAGNRLVTVRYATPKPLLAFGEHVLREPVLARDALTVLVRLLDAIIERLADELEASGAEIEKISNQIFGRDMDERRIPARRLTALLTRIGRAQSLLAKIRETAVSTGRLVSFVSASEPIKANDIARGHLASLMTDVTSLIDHSGFLGDNLIFLLDAALGLISVEQNAAMKLFSWAALIFLPPTLVAGIYGMNFEHMPELDWLYGYPIALVLILASAVLPILYFKRRGWI